MVKKIICNDVYGKSYQVPVASLSWRPSAYGVVIQGGMILLSRQFGDGFDLPGGGVDLGETPENAVIREVKEESGMLVDCHELITVKNSFFTAAHAEGEHYQSILFYYSCRVVGGKLGDVTYDEHEQQYVNGPEWLPIEQLSKIKISSTVDWREIVKEYL